MQVQTVNLGARVNMLEDNNRLFCRLDGLTAAAREQKRMTALKRLGLLDSDLAPHEIKFKTPFI